MPDDLHDAISQLEHMQELLHQSHLLDKGARQAIKRLKRLAIQIDAKAIRAAEASARNRERLSIPHVRRPVQLMKNPPFTWITWPVT